MVRPSIQANCSQGIPGHSMSAFNRDPAVYEWQLNVFQSRCAAEEVESLKYETKKIPAQNRPLISGQVLDLEILEIVITL